MYLFKHLFILVFSEIVIMYTLMLFQTCMRFFILLNTKEDILINAGNQTVTMATIVFCPYYESQNISNMVTLHVILVMLHRGHKVEALQGDTHERERESE